MIFSSGLGSSFMTRPPTGRHRTTDSGTTGDLVNDQNVAAVAIVAERLWYESVVAGIDHGRVQESVNKQCAQCFIDLVLNGYATLRDLELI